MPPAMKAFFDGRRVERLADELAAAWPPFPREAFVADATRGLARLELLDRGRHVAKALARTLPADYPQALAIVVRALGPPLASAEGNGMEPFHYLPHTIFVAALGLEHPDLSLAAQRELTRRFSCEFSIRPYIERHPERTMEELRRWTRDPDEHVRRLVSEGTRPRLPWAPRLRAFERDPSPALALLEALKDDPSAYVRRSVANHLNDVSKAHPDLVLATCARWLDGAPPDRARLVRHALRSLVRADHPEAIRLAGGVGGARLATAGRVTPRRARIGGSVRVEVEVTNEGHEAATAVLAVRVHFVTARGGTSAKSFKLPTTTLAPHGTAKLAKTVSLRQHTTRTHYAGDHVVDVVVNGEPRPLGRFRLDAA